MSSIRKSEIVSESGEELDELHRFSPAELSQFVLKKLDSQIMDRLWKHIDKDGTGHLKRKLLILRILAYLSVSYVTYRYEV